MCDGASPECPVDEFLQPDEVCRESNGECDEEERCTGDSAECPVDSKLGSAVICREVAGDCDAEERCNGADDVCPPDVADPAGEMCRDLNGQCDIEEFCDGTSMFCPADGAADNGTPCIGGFCVGGLCVDDTVFPPAPAMPCSPRSGPPKHWEGSGCTGNVLQQVGLCGVTLTHNSMEGALQHGYGHGWRMSWDGELKEQGGSLLVTRPTGEPILFSPTGAKWLPEPGQDSWITADGGDYLEHFKGGTTLRYELFGSQHRLVKVTDRYGQMIQVHRDTQGRATSITDSEGRAIQISWNGGLASTIVSVDGHVCSLTFYDNNELRFLTGPGFAGETQQEEFGYDSLGLHVITWRVSAGGMSTYFNYFDNAALRSVTDALGFQVRFHYAADRKRTSNSLEANITSTNHYPSEFFQSGQLIQSRDEAGWVTTFQRDGRRNVTVMDAPYRFGFSATYDGEDNITAYDPNIGLGYNATYDNAGNLLTYQQENGLSWVYTYDSHGLATSMTDPNQVTTLYNRNANGDLLSIIDSHGVMRYSAQYNSKGQALTETNMYGQTRSYSYSGPGSSLYYISDNVNGDTNTRFTLGRCARTSHHTTGHGGLHARQPRVRHRRFSSVERRSDVHARASARPRGKGYPSRELRTDRLHHEPPLVHSGRTHRPAQIPRTPLPGWRGTPWPILARPIIAWRPNV